MRNLKNIAAIFFRNLTAQSPKISYFWKNNMPTPASAKIILENIHFSYDELEKHFFIF